MKFTLSWLKKHLDTDATLEQISESLTDVGLEVESVVEPAARLESFTIGYVKKAEKHPDADKLKVCQVETDEGDLQIICGAPNARAGIYVVVAKPGTYVPGIDTTIAIGTIRGVKSFGMMCSEREMELSDSHDGIIELETGTVGEKFVEVLAKGSPEKIDPVIEIAITPNRPDALGVRGVARDLAARGIGQLKPQQEVSIEGNFPCPITVDIEPDACEACPVFYGRVIQGVKNGLSPDWLQASLRAIGLRPISFLVDVTNFFTFDQNRPLHVFDADKVKNRLRIHLARGGEKLVALDEKEYEMSAGMTLISDDQGLESIAGIMGGLSTACDENTQNVFIESAYFDPISTAISGRKLNINSDARYRFERGIDPSWTLQGLERATKLILDTVGGEPSNIVQAGEIPTTSRSYKFNPARVRSLVGMDISEDQQAKILEDLGFVLEDGFASPPSWRPDILGSADLVEEIVRIASLTKLVGVPCPRDDQNIAKPVLTGLQKRSRLIRRELARIGLNECVTYSFIDEKSARLLGGGADVVKLANPISQEMSHMRPNLYAGLMQAAGRNISRGFTDLSFFEIGQGWLGGEPEDQYELAAGILVGNTSGRNAFKTDRPYDVFDAKAVIAQLLLQLGFDIDKLVMLDHEAPWFHPARAAKLGLGPKNIIAEFGEIHPSVSKKMGIKGRVTAFALFYDNLPQSRKKTSTRPALVLHDLQSVKRDFAFVVEADIAAGALVKAIYAADKTLITDVSLFDVFEGEKAVEQMGDGRKSLAVSVTLTPIEKTLTEEDIQNVSNEIVKRAEKIGATLRG